MCVNDDPRGSSAGRLSRRLFLVSTPVFLAGCMSAGGNMTTAALPAGPDPFYQAMYGPKPDELFPLPATDIAKVDERFFRQQVDYHRGEPAGTVVVDTQNRFLYLVQEGGKAMRYGIGVGKAGLEFEGTAEVTLKREWPRWTPTQSMIERQPDRYAQYAGGMEPGLSNPLGPRALYLFQNGVDTLYRIHGTSEPWSIGLAVSSGCIRLFNQDIIDLYGRVPLGSTVVVLQNEPLMYPQREVPAWVARQIGDGQPLREPQVQPASVSGASPSLPPADVGATAPRPRRSLFGLLRS
jgi:lipoprotein-anchoring transpeptidase ErfK/SrfK